MKKISLLFLFFYSYSVLGSEESIRKISIENKLNARKGFCGGIFISKNIILTAYHCLHTMGNLSDLVVTELETKENTSLFVTPSYILTKFEYDIAFIVFPKPIYLGKIFKPIFLDISDNYLMSLTSYNYSDNETLNKYDFSSTAGEIILKNSNFISIFKTKDHLKEGDSGLPVLFENKILGVYSLGESGMFSPSYVASLVLSDYIISRYYKDTFSLWQSVINKTISADNIINCHCKYQKYKMSNHYYYFNNKKIKKIGQTIHKDFLMFNIKTKYDSICSKWEYSYRYLEQDNNYKYYATLSSCNEY